MKCFQILSQDEMEVNVAKLDELEKLIEQCRDEADAINEVRVIFLKKYQNVTK